jgi:predicted porin
MKLKHWLLGTSGLIGAGVLTVGTALPAGAAEVLPGGYPDITISGFAYFRAHGGQLDDARQDNSFSRNLDFSNDTEVHVLARAKDEQTGMEYGGTIEFEADTNRTDNTDETWIFVRGGWGEVRLGDEDGVADNSNVGASTIAAGTGGIDGSVVDTIAVPMVFLTNSNDATKIRYYTPSFGGFTFAVSYTPQQEQVDSGAENGDVLASVDVEAENVVDAGIIYDGEFGGTGVLASLVAITGDLKDEDSFYGDGSWHGWAAGVNVDLFGFKLAGSFADEKVGDADRNWFTAGIGAALGPVNTSVNYSQMLDTSDNYLGGEASNLVFSADVPIAPGLVLAGDVGIFDNDARDDNAYDGGDEGWQAIGRLGLAF